MPANILGVPNSNVFIPYTAATKKSKSLDITSYVTGSGYTTVRAVAIFEADSNGVWRINLNLSGTMASAGRTGVALTIAGVVFKNTSNYYPPLSCSAFGATLVPDCTVNVGDGQILIDHANTTTTGYSVSGWAELNAEPTWSSLGTTASAALEGVLPVDVFIPSASATESGLVTTGAQTIAGAKTFTGNMSFDGGTFVFNESGADKDFRIEGDTNANLFFCDASTDRVGIGTNSPDRDLQVESTGSAIIKIECGNGNASYVQFTEGGSSNEWYAGLVGNDGNKFRIANEGDVGVFISHGGTSWSSTSDYRLKENWKEIVGAVDILSSWSCGKYNLIGQPLTEIKVGLIAQEVKNTLPEVVDVAADSTLSIRYTEILPILVKAIQEQQSQIEELKSKLAILESK